MSGKTTEVMRLEHARPFKIEPRDSAFNIRQDESTGATLQADEVEIEVRAIGLDAVESSILNGECS
jgi:hypothetical protein